MAAVNHGIRNRNRYLLLAADWGQHLWPRSTRSCRLNVHILRSSQSIRFQSINTRKLPHIRIANIEKFRANKFFHRPISRNMARSTIGTTPSKPITMTLITSHTPLSRPLRLRENLSHALRTRTHHSTLRFHFATARFFFSTIRYTAYTINTLLNRLEIATSHQANDKFPKTRRILKFVRPNQPYASREHRLNASLAFGIIANVTESPQHTCITFSPYAANALDDESRAGCFTNIATDNDEYFWPLWNQFDETTRRDLRVWYRVTRVNKSPSK